MTLSPEQQRLNELTEQVIGCAYRISNTLGCGFVEKVYENALAIELRKLGLAVEQQRPLVVRYEGQVVGEFASDLLVEGCLLIELKAAESLATAHAAQCLNYLKGTGLRLCLLLSFGTPRVQIKRIVNQF